MRISVEIDPALLDEVVTLTGETQKSRALAKAIAEFVNRQRARQFGRLIREKAFDYPHPAEGEEDSTNPVPPLFRD